MTANIFLIKSIKCIVNMAFSRYATANEIVLRIFFALTCVSIINVTLGWLVVCVAWQQQSFLSL